MAFTFDPAKSASNKLKHGYDFEEAKLVWDDPHCVQIQAKVENEEERFAVLGYSR